MIANALSNTIYLGGLLALSGVIALTMLQFRLMGKYDKSLFTIFSVILYPAYELSPFEKRLRNIGCGLLVTGGLFVFVSFLFKRML